MKRLAILLLLGLSIVLTGCTSPVDITPGIIDVVFDNPHYQGETIVVDVWITNGTDQDEFIEMVDFWFELPEGTDLTGLDNNEVCGAQFDIFETVSANGYNDYELEFTTEFINITEAQLTALGLTLDDLVFYYLIPDATT